jgi:peptidoglycan/xylan/chitin deacetylase (PgdA/CDA1 family)
MPRTVRTALKRVGGMVSRERDASSILVFHSIGNGSPFSQPLDRFEEHIRYIASNYQIVPLRQLLEAPEARVRRVAITFDDGYADNYESVFPLLSRLCIPFTVFLTTGFVSGQKNLLAWSPHYRGLAPMTWAQIQEMHQAGVTFGSHTHQHRRLRTCSALQLKLELGYSKAQLEEHLSQPVDTIAYPFGQPHDLSDAVTRAAREAGYKFGLTTIHGFADGSHDAMALPRITIDAPDDLIDVQQKLAGRRAYSKYIGAARSLLITRGVIRPLIPDSAINL